MSLEKACMDNIVRQISLAPPYIQDMLIETTTAEMEHQAEEKVFKTLDSVVPGLVADVLDDIIRCKTQDGAYRLDFYGLYAHVPARIIRCAIESAELIGRTYENTLTEIPRWQMDYASDYDHGVANYDSVYSYDPDEED